MHSQEVVRGSLGVPGILKAKRTACPFRVAVNHKSPESHRCGLTSSYERRILGKHIALQASTSSFESELQSVKEEADRKLPDVPQINKDIK